MSSPGTILQGDLFYRKGLIPAQCIPNYTFQNCDFSKLFHMNMSNSSHTVKKLEGIQIMETHANVGNIMITYTPYV